MIFPGPVFDMLVICRFGEGVYPEGEGGGSEKTGEGAGAGYNANFAFGEDGMDDVDYILSFMTALLIMMVKIRLFKSKTNTVVGVSAAADFHQLWLRWCY